MSAISGEASGKTHRDENFPVASWLLSERHRAPILAFYRFARTADDVADDPGLSPDEKVRRLDALGAALEEGGPRDPAAEPLRVVLRERNLTSIHALDLLDAFRLDARKRRYADWADLMDYCRLSAMPVGRFVLDTHGEDRALWPASDALCAALQIINHLQDCGEDYRRLDRVYLPQDILSAHGAAVDMLAAPQAPPPLRRAIEDLARRTEALTDEGATLVPEIADLRLGLEVGAVHRLARHLVRGLQARDPLSERVHHGKAAFALIGALGAMRYARSALIRSLGARPKVPA